MQSPPPAGMQIELCAENTTLCAPARKLNSEHQQQQQTAVCVRERHRAGPRRLMLMRLDDERERAHT